MFLLELDLDAGQCTLWRISFSAAEKEIILHSDGELKCTSSDTKTHRKDVLRLLKDDVEQLNKNKLNYGCLPRKILNSYHVKTIFLHYLDRVVRDDEWNDEAPNLRERYVEAVKFLIERVRERNLPHYFIDQTNLMEYLKDVDAARAEVYFSAIATRYGKCSLPVNQY